MEKKSNNKYIRIAWDNYLLNYKIEGDTKTAYFVSNNIIEEYYNLLSNSNKEIIVEPKIIEYINNIKIPKLHNLNYLKFISILYRFGKIKEKKIDLFNKEKYITINDNFINTFKGDVAKFFSFNSKGKLYYNIQGNCDIYFRNLTLTLTPLLDIPYKGQCTIDFNFKKNSFKASYSIFFQKPNNDYKEEIIYLTNNLGEPINGKYNVKDNILLDFNENITIEL